MGLITTVDSLKQTAQSLFPLPPFLQVLRCFLHIAMVKKEKVLNKISHKVSLVNILS